MNSDPCSGYSVVRISTDFAIVVGTSRHCCGVHVALISQGNRYNTGQWRLEGGWNQVIECVIPADVKRAPWPLALPLIQSPQNPQNQTTAAGDSSKLVIYIWICCTQNRINGRRLQIRKILPSSFFFRNNNIPFNCCEQTPPCTASQLLLLLHQTLTVRKYTILTTIAISMKKKKKHNTARQN